jgi:hypothetical protein
LLSWIQTDRRLAKAGCSKVFREVASGAKTDRTQLRKALDRLGAGDVLMVTRLDRLARSTRAQGAAPRRPGRALSPSSPVLDVAAVDLDQPAEQVGAIKQPFDDEVGDRHLGLLDLALHPTLGDEQPPETSATWSCAAIHSKTTRLAAPCSSSTVQEDHPLGRARTLAD